MARESRKVTIEGLVYSITQLGAVESRRLSILFMQLVGPLIPRIVKAVSGDKKLSQVGEVAGLDLDADGLIDLVGALQSIEPDKLEPLWEAFAANAIVQSGTHTIILRDAFDEHFAGDMQFAMWRFFIESAKVNFGGFLARALGNKSAAPAAPAP